MATSKTLTCQKLRYGLMFIILYSFVFFVRSTSTNESSTVNTTANEKSGMFKNESGAGHFYGQSNQQEYDSNYNYQQQYGSYNRPPQMYNFGYTTHLIDDYICDLEASIVIVANSKKNAAMLDGPPGANPIKGSLYGIPASENNQMGYVPYSNPQLNYLGYNMNAQMHGFGKKRKAMQNLAEAYRLRCSEIAATDDKTCTTCCQLASRRDRSISKNTIMGFLVDETQIKLKKDSNRKDEQLDESEDLLKASEDPNKCICCAPKVRYLRENLAQYAYQKPAYGNHFEYQKSMYP